MSFLDKLKKTAANASVAAANVANTAVQQTKTAATIGKLKLNMAQEEDKMKKAYTELGRLYYRDHENDAQPELEEYLPWIQRVSDAKAAIAELSQQVEAVKAQNQTVDVVDATEPEEAEDTSIYVDFAEAEAPVAVSVDVTEEPKDETEATEEAETLEMEEPAPTIGTLYVDISGQE